MWAASPMEATASGELSLGPTVGRLHSEQRYDARFAIFVFTATEKLSRLLIPVTALHGEVLSGLQVAQARSSKSANIST